MARAGEAGVEEQAQAVTESPKMGGRCGAVAIVGSRDFADEQAVRAYVRALPTGTTVVSGGARGPDSWAENEARLCALGVVVFHAEWDRLGRRAGFLRNKLIVDRADRVVAFWDQRSRGTQHTIDLAREAGKPVEIVLPR